MTHDPDPDDAPATEGAEDSTVVPPLTETENIEDEGEPLGANVA